MELAVIERARDMMKNVTMPEYFNKVGREQIEILIAELEKNETTLREENDKLKRLCRFQFFTLGYYGTHYNYDSKNIAYHPISGQAASGIMWDGGHDARQSQAVSRALGFDGEEIMGWSGPGVKILYGEELEAEYAVWYEKQTGKKIEKTSGSDGVPAAGLVNAATHGPDGSVRPS